MKAKEANFLQFLRDPKQFIIPIYQRTYSWSQAQCQQLWNDIVQVATNPKMPGHFIGSIVYIEQGIYHATSLPQLLVIDGQQRLTTLSLLLSVLGKAVEESGQAIKLGETVINYTKIRNYYLVNNDEDGDLRYKLMLTRSDKDSLIGLVENHGAPVTSSPRIVENYSFFERRINERKISLDAVYEGIGKLLIVDVSLHREQDNPQLIFESLNSTGLDLSQADLIRNYILMGLPPSDQNTLYNQYWYPMEQSFGHAEYSAQFDRFMRDYLTIKNQGNIPNIKDVYTTFKNYSRQAGVSVEELVADIYRYSVYFVRLNWPQNEDDWEVRAILDDINTLKVDVAYPFLLEVYDDYWNGKLSRDDFIAILRLVESYVFRRAVCGIPTNSLNKTFATLSRLLNKDSYLESVQATFLLKDSYRRFSRDDEFRAELIRKDVYNFRNRNYLLDKLENIRRKERILVGEWTIEHILPQNENLSAEWRNELGDRWREIQSTYLHTIGNLTLTGYNSELSDRPFHDKRDMEGGFRDSPIRLNATLRNLDHWDESTILERAHQLADIALQIWSVPDLSPNTLKYYQDQTEDREAITYSLDQYEHLDGKIFELYNLLRCSAGGFLDS